ncbi:MAG: hypothetical protein IPG32_16760 [Saprospirales bacterium]|nr:hypothetical protein [Saprospirales bacterium]
MIDLLDWSKGVDNDAVIEPGEGIGRLYQSGISMNLTISFPKLFFLDGLAFAREIGESSWQPGKYFSVDVFLYARCCAVANGFEFSKNS